LPTVAELNLRALRSRASSSLALDRYSEVAHIITGNDAARAEDGVAWLVSLVEELRVPKLSAYGIRDEDIAHVVAAARQASSMQGNPIVLTDDELVEALRMSI
jgi:alcohol dehydrogenase class IV